MRFRRVPALIALPRPHHCRPAGRQEGGRPQGPAGEHCRWQGARVFFSRLLSLASRALLRAASAHPPLSPADRVRHYPHLPRPPRHAQGGLEEGREERLAFHFSLSRCAPAVLLLSSDRGALCIAGDTVVCVCVACPPDHTRRGRPHVSCLWGLDDAEKEKERRRTWWCAVFFAPLSLAAFARVCCAVRRTGCTVLHVAPVMCFQDARLWGEMSLALFGRNTKHGRCQWRLLPAGVSFFLSFSSLLRFGRERLRQRWASHPRTVETHARSRRARAPLLFPRVSICERGHCFPLLVWLACAGACATRSALIFLASNGWPVPGCHASALSVADGKHNAIVPHHCAVSPLFH